MGDYNNPDNNNNQQNNQNAGDNPNQQQNNQQPQYGGQQYQQPQYGGQPEYQQPGYSGQSSYQQNQQSQYQQTNPYQQPYNPYQQPQKKDNGMAIGSLVCGIVSVVLCCAWYLTIPAAIVGIILGILTIKNNKDGRTMAIIGIVLSGLGVIVGIIVAISTFTVVNNTNFWDQIMDQINNGSFDY